MDDDLKQDNMKVLDRSGMLEKILEVPRQLRIGWELGNAPTAEIDIGRFSHIVFGGMGGSAITGDLLVSLFSSR